MNQNTITYSNDNKSEFINELRALVAQYFEKHNLSKYGNVNLVVKTVVMFLLYLGPLVLMLTGVVNSWLAVYGCWIIMGFGKAGVGMGVMHDANHRSYSKNQKVNKFLSKSIFLLGGFTANWQRQHNTLHHGFTNVEGKDEDIEATWFLRFSPHKPLKKIHKFQYLYAWFFYGLMTILWITTKDFTQLRRYQKQGLPLSHNKSYRQLYTSLIIWKVAYYIIFLILPLIFIPIAWYWILLFFFTMHFISGFTLSIIFQTAHVVPTSEYPLPDNTGTIENSFAVHQLFNTSDFAPKNKFLSWFVGGLNFQIEHHLFPGISHVHYHKIASLVKELAQKYNLPYHVQPGFFKAVWEHGRMLKRLGRA